MTRPPERTGHLLSQSPFRVSLTWVIVADHIPTEAPVSLHFLDARTPRKSILCPCHLLLQITERIAGHPCDEQCARITLPSPVLAYGCRRLLQSATPPEPLSVEGRTDTDLRGVNQPDRGDKRKPFQAATAPPYTTSNAPFLPLPLL